MKVLILGPTYPGGSLPPYLDSLAAGLAGHGVTVERAGSTSPPYDQDQQRFWPADRIVAEAQSILDSVDLDSYDVLSVHFGNLEIDQLLPTIWTGGPRPPAVYHAHTLAPTLFRIHVPNPGWNDAVQEGIRSFDGQVHFGQYARDQLTGTLPPGRPTAVAWLPTTIPPGTAPIARPALAEALAAPKSWPVISLYGYAAPWKDAALLRAALEQMSAPARIVLAGDFWDNPDQAGTDLRDALTPVRVGPGELVVVPGYVDPTDRTALIQATTAAVFPYRTHPSFQGSGAIADYLAHAVPVIATDVANMSELIGEAGNVVPAADPSALAAALDRAVEGDARGNLHGAATARAHCFTAKTHAARCLEIYKRVIDPKLADES